MFFEHHDGLGAAVWTGSAAANQFERCRCSSLETAEFPERLASHFSRQRYILIEIAVNKHTELAPQSAVHPDVKTSTVVAPVTEHFGPGCL